MHRRQCFSASFLLILLLPLTSCEANDDHSLSDVRDFLNEEIVDEYVAPMPSGTIYFFEPFDIDWTLRWTHSHIAKYSGRVNVGKDAHYQGIQGDFGMELSMANRYYAVSAPFFNMSHHEGQTFVVQYEVKYLKRVECGGAYIKLYADSLELNLGQVDDRTPFSLMFGPDRCGGSNSVVLYFNIKNPHTGKFEEKRLLNSPPGRADSLPHLYTLIIRQDDSYEIMIDMESVRSGFLRDDVEPSLEPELDIEDVLDEKPKDWVDVPVIEDMSATKPDNWDEDAPMYVPDHYARRPLTWRSEVPLKIPDPQVQKPSTWSDAEDGEWKAPLIPNPDCPDRHCGDWTPPMIRNPDYKGPWTRPLIENPLYKGEWRRRRIPNPGYFKVKYPHAAILPSVALGIEVWTQQDGIRFDNFLVCSSVESALSFASLTWRLRYNAERGHRDLQSSVKPKDHEEGGRFSEEEKKSFSQRFILMLTVVFFTKPFLAGLMILLLFLTMYAIFVGVDSGATRATRSASRRVIVISEEEYEKEALKEKLE